MNKTNFLQVCTCK